MRDTHRERGRDIGRGRSRLYPRTPGSGPELKADTQPLNHPDALNLGMLNVVEFVLP